MPEAVEGWLSIWVKMVYSNAGIKQLSGSILCESVESCPACGGWHCTR